MSQPDASSSGFAVPEYNRSPARSLRPTPVVFTVGGLDYELPPLPAADWLNTLMQPWTPDDLLLDLVPNGVQVALRIEPEDVEPLVLALIEEASGRDWWVALRLVGAVQGGWSVLGPEMILQGVDPERLSLAAWLDAMTLLILRAMNKDDHAMFLSQVELPPVEVREQVAEEMEMSRDQFMSLMRG